METDFFWRKWKRNGVFRRNRCGNGSFRFWLIWISVLWLFCMTNLAGLIYDLVILNYQSNPPLLPNYTE
jgi:hypothetical protein